MTELRDILDGCTVVASVSGGKDSAAMCLWLQEQDIPHRRVFADTGWEAQQTYDYLRGPLTAKLGPIDEVRGPLGFAGLVRKKGMFPSRLTRFCTTELKVRPVARYLHRQPWPAINAVGVRAAESKARSKLPEWERAPTPMNVDTWRPLLRWAEQDVIDIHARHGLAPNPLYLRGASRVGCWPCIYARKGELRMLDRLDPGRVDEIQSLEAELGYTLFHHHSDSGPVAIDSVIAWARTDYGGKQLLLADPEPPGCMRWGLCEAATEES